VSGKTDKELVAPEKASRQKKNRAPQITLSTLYNPKKPNENFLKKTPEGENLLLQHPMF